MDLVVRIIGEGEASQPLPHDDRLVLAQGGHRLLAPLHRMVRGEEDVRQSGQGENVRAIHPLWLPQKGFLSADGIHHAVTHQAQLAGIQRRIWPHLLRHSFGDRIKAATGSDEVVMTLGRWRDAKAMRRYGASAALQRARVAHRQASPGDRF